MTLTARSHRASFTGAMLAVGGSDSGSGSGVQFGWLRFAVVWIIVFSGVFPVVFPGGGRYFGECYFGDGDLGDRGGGVGGRRREGVRDG